MKLPVVFDPIAFEEYTNWFEKDPKILLRINDLIKDIQRNYFKGIGKPEPLKYDYKGCWSRRINHEHRLIYKVENDRILIIKCEDHY